MDQPGHTHTQARCKRSGFVGFALALVCAWGWAGQASANSQPLPKRLTTVPTSLSDPARHGELEEGVLSLAETPDLPARIPLYKRYRKLKVLSYTRNLEVGQEEVRVKVQSPGRRRSIIGVELHF